jgi:hypothetical protein
MIGTGDPRIDLNTSDLVRAEAMRIKHAYSSWEVTMDLIPPFHLKPLAPFEEPRPDWEILVRATTDEATRTWLVDRFGCVWADEDVGFPHGRDYVDRDGIVRSLERR